MCTESISNIVDNFFLLMVIGAVTEFLAKCRVQKGALIMAQILRHYKLRVKEGYTRLNV